MALAGPAHISSSVPTEFESTLDGAAFMERLFDFLRSRNLARHVHATLKGGAGSLLLGLRRPWIVMGDGSR